LPGALISMIDVQELAKYFGKFSALRDLSLAVKPGEFIALFGRNGAGKTTFLRILAGLTRPSSGVVHIRGLSPRQARGMMGYLSHNTALYADLTALENLRFYAQLNGLPLGESELESRIGSVGLAARGREPVRNFSRGMQQRLAIARAFLHDPEILLLDEPFTGLDQPGTEFLKRYLSQANARGRTCLMAIHDAPLGFELASRLVVIDRGTAAIDILKSSTSLEAFQGQYRARALER
jgi:heme ABC exporter ATP-binding subunit CcmA